MATTTSNIRKRVQGNVRVLEGDWTNTAVNDAPFTVTLPSGATILSAQVSNQDADSNSPKNLEWSFDGTTFTAYVQGGIATRGRFSIEYKGA